MRGARFVLLLCLALLAGCARHAKNTAPPPTAYGAAIIVSSGDKQVAAVGATLGDPVVVQVNDAQGAAVPGAPVTMEAAPGVTFNPPSGLTDSSGQFTAQIS